MPSLGAVLINSGGDLFEGTVHVCSVCLGGCVIFGQTVPTTKARVGQVHAELVDNVMVVYSGGDEWKIDLATLPFNEFDCSPEDEAYNRSVAKLSGGGHNPTVVGSTLSPPRVFFTLWTGMYAQNVTHVLFEAEAARHSIRRLLSGESHIENVAVSPSGRYLAYSVEWSEGVCHHTSSVFVADLGVLNKGTEPATVAAVDVVSPHMLAEPVSWATGERLVFRESTFDGDDSCRRNQRTVTVSKLLCLTLGVQSTTTLGLVSPCCKTLSQKCGRFSYLTVRARRMT
jgi:hypothetical protein